MRFKFNYPGDVEYIGQLRELKSLNLDHCHLEDLSVLKDLKGLESISLCFNKLNGLEFLSELNKLKKIDIVNNLKGITILDVQNMPFLNHLDVRNNQINKAIFKNLPELEHLDLSKLSIQELKIVDIPNLRHLSIEKNSISHFPYDLVTKLEKLESLNLSYNPIRNIPREIFDSTKNCLDELRTYVDSIKISGDVSLLNEAKMVLIGNGEVGKSSIRIKLLDKSVELPEKKDRTQGLDISVETYKIKDLEINSPQSIN